MRDLQDLDQPDIDYIRRRNDCNKAVTVKGGRRVAAELCKPFPLSVVVVGQPDSITPTRPTADGAS
ncbi:MAG: hypothetical protein ACFCUQ_16110 [Kiloniellales bacterium]